MLKFSQTAFDGRSVRWPDAANNPGTVPDRSPILHPLRMQRSSCSVQHVWLFFPFNGMPLDGSPCRPRSPRLGRRSKRRKIRPCLAAGRSRRRTPGPVALRRVFNHCRGSPALCDLGKKPIESFCRGFCGASRSANFSPRPFPHFVAARITENRHILSDSLPTVEARIQSAQRRHATRLGLLPNPAPREGPLSRLASPTMLADFYCRHHRYPVRESRNLLETFLTHSYCSTSYCGVAREA